MNNLHKYMDEGLIMNYENRMNKNQSFIDNMIAYLKRGVQHNPNVSLRNYWCVIKRDFPRGVLGNCHNYSLAPVLTLVNTTDKVLKHQYSGFWVCGKFYCYTTTVKELHNDLVNEKVKLDNMFDYNLLKHL